MDDILATYHTTDERKQEFLGIMQNRVYKYYDDVSVESLASETYYFLDDEDNLLFQVTSWGNGEIVRISFDNSTVGYYYSGLTDWNGE